MRPYFVDHKSFQIYVSNPIILFERHIFRSHKMYDVSTLDNCLYPASEQAIEIISDLNIKQSTNIQSEQKYN